MSQARGPLADSRGRGGGDLAFQALGPRYDDHRRSKTHRLEGGLEPLFCFAGRPAVWLGATHNPQFTAAATAAEEALAAV